jgi:hypothetical protein
MTKEEKDLTAEAFKQLNANQDLKKGIHMGMHESQFYNGYPKHEYVPQITNEELQYLLVKHNMDELLEHKKTFLKMSHSKNKNIRQESLKILEVIDKVLTTKGF